MIFNILQKMNRAENGTVLNNHIYDRRAGTDVLFPYLHSREECGGPWNTVA